MSILPDCSVCGRWSFFRCGECGQWRCFEHETTHACVRRDVILRKVRCFLGRHRHDKVESFAPTGYATLAWSRRPEREFRSVRSCACGVRKVQSGLLNFQDRQQNPDAYPGDGYPIDEAGQRMPVSP